MTELAGVNLTFWMRRLGSNVPAVAGEPATFEDVSVAYGKAPQTTYIFTYTFAPEDVDTLGRYDARFRQDFGGGTYLLRARYRHLRASSYRYRGPILVPGGPSLFHFAPMC